MGKVRKCLNIKKKKFEFSFNISDKTCVDKLAETKKEARNLAFVEFAETLYAENRIPAAEFNTKYNVLVKHNVATKRILERQRQR
jgi:hypothetical protein